MSTTVLIVLIIRILFCQGELANNSNVLKILIILVCEIFEVIKLYIVLGVFFAADFKNASNLALSGLVFLQISILFFTLENFNTVFKQNI